MSGESMLLWNDNNKKPRKTPGRLKNYDQGY